VLIVSFLLSVFVVMSSVCLSSLARHFGPVIKTALLRHSSSAAEAQAETGTIWAALSMYRCVLLVCIYFCFFFVTPVSVLLVCAVQ
jgi:hypothetical protein